MTWITVDHTETIAQMIIERRHKATIDGIEVMLPKQPYGRMTRKERERDAIRKAKHINNLLT